MTRCVRWAVWVLTGAIAAWPGHAQRPSLATDLLQSYVEWIEGRRPAFPLVAVDLDVARADLARVAPNFLLPLEGPVSALKGACPALTFTLAGVTLSTSAATHFEDGACAAIANRTLIRVIRQPDYTRPLVRVALRPEGTMPPKVQVADERQRRLLVTFAIELAAVASTHQAAAAARLAEWACPYVRNHAPQDEFDRAWHLSALSLLEGGIDSRQLLAHLEHSQAALADEPRAALARGIAEEQSTAPAEALSGQAEDVAAARASALVARSDADHKRAADRAVTRFGEAAADARVRAEARLRLGHVQFDMQRPDAALRSWEGVETETTDQALVYLVSLFRGLAFDRLGRVDAAETAYVSALRVSPRAHSATVRLAALAFRNGRVTDADALVAKLLKDDDPRRDPWWLYYAADWRFWYPRIDDVRRLLR